MTQKVLQKQDTFDISCVDGQCLIDAIVNHDKGQYFCPPGTTQNLGYCTPAKLFCTNQVNNT